MLGAQPGDLGDEVVELWEENLVAFHIFMACVTQWHVGMGGRSGLRYDVARKVARWYGVKKRDWLDVFDQLRTLEAAVLELKAED